jgi:hypothetical protein
VLRRWHDTGPSEAREFRPGPRPLLSPTCLEKLVLQHPDATLAELGGRLQVSGATVCRALHQMDLPRKKVTASQRAQHTAGGAATCPWTPDAPGFGAHKVAGVAEAQQAAGVSLYYRPPCSLDDSPREEASSKIKTWLRAAGARSRAHLHRALERALFHDRLGSPQ